MIFHKIFYGKMGDDINNSNPESLARITAEVLYQRGYSVKVYYGKNFVLHKTLQKNNGILIDIDEKNSTFWINEPNHLSYLPCFIDENLWIIYPGHLA